MTMPHTPTITGTHTAAPTPYQTIARFLDTIYGTQSGYCCLGYIDGDPRYEAMHQEWYAWPRERRTVVHRLVHWTQHGLNVYMARCLFTNQKRSYATAVPSSWLWLDDAAADTDATLLIETSAQNYQAWLQLAHPVTADEASQLQRRWRQAANADSCSADAVHMVRVPGGVNTKGHGCFPVTLVQQTATTYRLADLPWPLLPDTPDTLPTINLAHVETQRADLRPLLNDQGIPRRFKPHMQSYKVLTGEIVVHNRAGIADQSDPRYWITKGLAYCRYTHEDAYTILLALTDSTWLTQKGFDWHHTDILRCITKAYHEVYAHVARNGQDWQARPVTAREQAYGTTPAIPNALPYTTKRKRRGRPSRVTPADVLDYWHGQVCGDRCIYTRKETAHALRISVATLDRHIKHLKDSGTIKIETPAHRQYSVIILIELTSDTPAQDAVGGTIKNTVAQDTVEATRNNPAVPDADSGTIKNTDNAPQMGYDEVLSADRPSAQSDARNTQAQLHGGTHPHDRATPSTPPSAAAAPSPGVARTDTGTDTANAVPGPPRGVCSSDTTTDQAAAGYPALWHAHESDLPVTVVTFLGLGPDGRAYVSIAESSTGIPFDEVTFLAPDQALDVATAVPAPPAQAPDALPDQATSAPTVSLATAVAEAFDAITTRRTQKRIRAYLELNYPEMLQSDSALVAQIAYERLQRKLATLHDMKLNGLKSELRLAEHKAQKARDSGTNEWRWWDWYASEVRAELNRRPQRKRAPRKLYEAVPDVRQVAQEHHTYQRRLWQGELDTWLRQAPKHYPTPVACTVTVTPPTPSDTTYDAAGLIARLRQRQVQTA